METNKTNDVNATEIVGVTEIIKNWKYTEEDLDEVRYFKTREEAIKYAMDSFEFSIDNMEESKIEVEELSDNVGDIVDESEVNLGFEKPCITEEELDEQEAEGKLEEEQ